VDREGDFYPRLGARGRLVQNGSTGLGKGGGMGGKERKKRNKQKDGREKGGVR